MSFVLCTYPMRRGHTLLELIMAVSLLGVALVPALALMRDGVKISRSTEAREMMTTLGVGKMEEQLALVSADASWTTGTTTGNFAAAGFSNLRFRVDKTDDSGSLTLGGNLMAITTTVWDDQDGDTIQDAAEPAVVMATKVAKMTTYQAP